MNERIQNILDQAINAMPEHLDFDIPKELAEKFAELIVRECMKLNSKELSITAIERLLPLYEEHFGVKE
jgi:FKBP-type peptidyl-prolyl cis-trans isomerase (trigger factor)